MTDLEFALGRIEKVALAIAAGGALVALAWDGWTWGAGFILGAALSWVNFRWTRQVAYAAGSLKPPKRVVAIFALRYALLGGAAYVILRFSKVSMPAMLCGLFVPVAAVIVEIIIQLAYART